MSCGGFLEGRFSASQLALRWAGEPRAGQRPRCGGQSRRCSTSAQRSCRRLAGIWKVEKMNDDGVLKRFLPEATKYIRRPKKDYNGPMMVTYPCFLRNGCIAIVWGMRDHLTLAFTGSFCLPPPRPFFHESYQVWTFLHQATIHGSYTVLTQWPLIRVIRGHLRSMTLFSHNFG